jgi:hypothetical protein
MLDKEGWVSPDGLFADNEGWLLLSPAGGGTDWGKIEGLPESAG